MPHVELSLTEDASRRTSGRSARSEGAHVVSAARQRNSLERWSAATTGATEPSLVIDIDTCVMAISDSCATLIGVSDPASARGRPLRETIGRMLDFTGNPGELDSAEADKIPPLLAISSGSLARGLMRVVNPVDGEIRTVDVVATPLWDGTTVVGSLSFFCKV